MKKLIFLFLFGIGFCYGQIPTTADSLAIFLAKKKKDTTYVLAQNEYVFLMYQRGEYKKGDSCNVEMDKLSHKLGFPTGLYKSANMKGVKEYFKQDFRAALQQFEKAHAIIVKHNLGKTLHQNSLNNFLIIYNQTGEKEKAIRRAFELIEYQNTNKLNPLKSTPYEVIGTIHKEKGEYKEALNYMQKALAIEKGLSSLVGVAVMENRIGNVYDDMKQYQKAIQLYSSGLKHAEQAEHSILQTDMLINLGRMYSDKVKDWKKAAYYFKKCEDILEKSGSRASLKMVKQNLGDLYFYQKKFQESESYYLEAYSISLTLGDPNHVYSASRGLADLYAYLGDFKRAFEYQEKASAAKDSVSVLEAQAVTEELVTAYKTREKEQEIALLNEKSQKEKLLNRSLIAGGILVVFFAGTVIYSIINRNKLRRLKESTALRNKIAADLHDEIGSTLSSILLVSSMAKDSGEISTKAIDKIYRDSVSIAGSVDEIIWSINPSNDSIQKIFMRLMAFAKPIAEQGNLNIKFHWDSALEEINIPLEIRQNVYFVIKEALNNMFKYAGAKEAEVTFIKEKNILKVSVKDDGTGFDLSAVTDRNGIRNMQNRVKYMHGNIEIHSQNGTIVVIQVPIT